MGGLVLIWRAGADGIFGTADDQKTLLYLTDAAIKLYQSYPNVRVIIEYPLPDSTVNIFGADGLSPTSVNGQIATFDQIVAFAEAAGLTQGDAVAFAQSIQGATIKQVMDMQNTLNAKAAAYSQQVINQQLSYEQSLLSPAFQTPVDTSVTKSFTEPTGTPSLYPSDTFAGITGGIASGLPNLSSISPSSETSIIPVVTPPLNFVVNPETDLQKNFVLQFGKISYVDDIVKVEITITTIKESPITPVNLYIQILNDSKQVLKIDKISIDSKPQIIDKTYVIGNRVTQKAYIEAFLWNLNNDSIATSINSSTSWQPSFIGKIIPLPTVVTKTVSIVQKHESLFLYAVLLLAVGGITWYTLQHPKKVKETIKKIETTVKS